MDAREIVAARRGGEFAARSGLHAATCPYRGDATDQQVLRRIWLTAYLRVAPPPSGTITHDEKSPERT
jgi:hypothetical protein